MFNGINVTHSLRHVMGCGVMDVWCKIMTVGIIQIFCTRQYLLLFDLMFHLLSVNHGFMSAL